MKFHHVGVHVADYRKSKRLYDALMETLGFDGYEVPEHVAFAWGTIDNSFRIVQPPTGDISSSSSHICFEAPNEEAVAKFFDRGMELGANGLEPPAEYVEWGRRHLSAMVQDFDGNCLEAVFVDRQAPAVVSTA